MLYRTNWIVEQVIHVEQISDISRIDKLLETVCGDVISFLANVNSRSRTFAICYRRSDCLSVVCRLSSDVCNVGTPYSAD